MLDPRLRALWDAAPLGPSHVQARRVARALLAVRAGCRPTEDDVPPPVVHTVLPLPWAIELACRLHALRSPGGMALAAWLVDRLGNRARDEGDVDAAIAAAAQRHDPDRVAAAAGRARRALDELGVDPEPATVVLLRHAGAPPPG